MYKEIKIILHLNEGEGVQKYETMDDEIIITDLELAEKLQEMIKISSEYKYVISAVRNCILKEQWEKSLEILKKIKDEEIFLMENNKEDIILKAKVLLKNDKINELDGFIRKAELNNIDYLELSYFKALINEKRNYNYLAIKNYKNLINKLEIVDDESKKILLEVYINLAELLYKERDYGEAKEFYERYMKESPISFELLNNYAKSVFNSEKDRKNVYDTLKPIFNMDNINEVYTFGEILLNCGMYEYSLTLFLEANKIQSHDKILIKLSDILLYLKQYNKSKEIAEFINPNSNCYDLAQMNKMIITVILNENSLDKNIELIENEDLKRAFYIMVSEDEENQNILGQNNSTETMKWYILILDTIIKTKEFYIFEKCLKGIKYIDNSLVLDSITQLYKDNSYNELAVEQLVNSMDKIKEFISKNIEFLYHNLKE